MTVNPLTLIGPSGKIEWALKSDGLPVPRLYEGALLSVLIQKEANRIPTARLVFKDGNAAKQDFELSNTTFFIPGKKIEIQAGTVFSKDILFQGIVIRYQLKTRANGESLLIVECKDEAVKMTAARKNACFSQQKDSDVFQTIIQSYGLTPDLEDTQLAHEQLVQYNTTDWDFLVSRAEANGKVVLVSDGTVAVKTPALVNTGTNLEFLYGQNILDLDLEIDTRLQTETAKTQGWDPAGQTVTEVEGIPPVWTDLGDLASADLGKITGTGGISLRHSGALDPGELQSWADSARLKAAVAKVRGRIRCRGTAQLQPGATINIAGVGGRFKGLAYVSGVRHEISEGAWSLDVQVGLAPEWFSGENDMLEPPAAGLLPAVNGLQIGVVTQLQGDPAGEERIKVQLPLVVNSADGIWARIVALDAGANRGTCFRPEIGDEVVVGFLNDDPRHALMLGMLHSSAKPAPLPVDDKNPQKGYFSRDGIKFLFDDQHKTVTLETPGGRKLVLDDKAGIVKMQDKKSSVTLSGQGIELKSSGKITLKADGDLELEGKNINIKAKAQLKAAGSGGTEVSSPATTVLKGGLVQIN